MGITLKDMDKVEAWKGGAVLQPGKHKVVILTAEEGKSSGGYPQVEMDFEAEDGTGSIRDWLVFSGEESLGKAKMLLDALGIVSESGEWEFPTTTLLGRKLVITVADQPYQGKSKMRVVGYAPPGSDVPGSNGSGTDDDIPF